MTGSNEQLEVYGKDGLMGTIEAALLEDAGADERVPIRLRDGNKLMVAKSSLVWRSEESYYLPVDARTIHSVTSAHPQDGDTIILPIAVEEVRVEKNLVESGRVRITKRVNEREEIIEEPLLREEVTVERVAINRIVDEPTQTRSDGDTLIVPVFEEVFVVEKRLMLKEELHITRRQHHEILRQSVTLRSEEPVIERLSGDDAPTVAGVGNRNGEQGQSLSP